MKDAEHDITKKIKEAGKHSIIYGIGSIAQSALGFILLPILTTSFNEEEFGAYSLILMSCTIVSAIFYLGMTSALPRSYYDYPEGNERKSVFTTAFLMLLIGSCLQIFIGSYYSEAISLFLLKTQEHSIAIFWAFLGGALTFINQYFFTYLRLIRKSLSVVVFSIMSLLLGVALTLLLLEIRNQDISAPFEAIVYSQLLITSIFLILHAPQAFTTKLKTKEIIPLLHFGVASILASFGNMLLDWADRLIIERYMTLSDVGLYSAAVRVSSLITVLVVVPFTQIWTPMMMEYRKNENIKQLFSIISSYYFIFGSIIIITATLFSKEILNILIKYDSTELLTVIFTIIMTANLIYGSSNIVVAGIFYERKVYLLPIVYYTISGVKISMNLLLVPAYGLIGAAVSTLVTATLIPIGIYIYAKKYFSFKFQWLRITKIIIITIAPIVYAMLAAYEQINQAHILLRIAFFILTLVLLFKYCLFEKEKEKAIKLIKHVKSKVFNHA